MKVLRHVRKCVSEDIAKSLATSLVGARLDYCNAISHGTSRNNIDKLQQVQNTLARVVEEHGKYDHITPLLSHLHWLPIEARMRHEIAVLTFKAVSIGKPSSLAELVHTHTLTHTPARELRYPVYGGLSRCMFPTSELHSVATLFIMLRQQCGTVCRRKSRTLRFHSKHSSLG